MKCVRALYEVSNKLRADNIQYRVADNGAAISSPTPTSRSSAQKEKKYVATSSCRPFANLGHAAVLLARSLPRRGFMSSTCARNATSELWLTVLLANMLPFACRFATIPTTAPVGHPAVARIVPQYMPQRYRKCASREVCIFFCAQHSSLCCSCRCSY